MKKILICGTAGILLCLLGISGILDRGDSMVWPFTVFLGCFCILLPAGGSWNDSWELFSLSSPDWQSESHESLMLAQYFIGMAWLARYEGILALYDTKFDKDYGNGSYHLCKEMMIDGMEPEDIRQEFSSITKTQRQRFWERKTRLVQTGKWMACLCAMGTLSCGAALAFREMASHELPRDSFIGIVLAAVVCLGLSLILGWLLPETLSSILQRRNLLQRQIMAGMSGVQNGKSPLAILQEQLPFLTVKERGLLMDTPLPSELRENRENQFDTGTEDLRYTLRRLANHRL